jgi:hypothetical protein
VPVPQQQQEQAQQAAHNAAPTAEGEQEQPHTAVAWEYCPSPRTCEEQRGSAIIDHTCTGR